MALLAAHGIELDLPDGWDGRIRRRPVAEVEGVASAASLATPVVAHAATFPLPMGAGDFGGGAVEQMTNLDLFAAVVEFDPDSLGTVLFRRSGVPRRLRPTDFHPQGLQRTLPGQAGAQVFFTEADRPFCLYVVLGSSSRRVRTVPVVNELLGGLRIT